MQKRNFVIIMVLSVLIAGVFYYSNQTVNTGSGKEKPKVVITLGQDLTGKQKDMVMKMFAKYNKTKEAQIITVTNHEEKKYLAGKIEDNLIGSRAISSAYLELLDGTDGIEVDTENITAISPFMYANALATAGVEDARVVVAAPFEVSGTAALTGIIKAFETANNEKLEDYAKETAYNELTETYKLGNKYGKKNTENMIYDIKKEVIEKEVFTESEIKPIIIKISNQYNINLTEAEIDRIIILMQSYKNINLDTGKLEAQLRNAARNLAEVQGIVNNSRSFLEKITIFFKNLVIQIENMFIK